MSDHPPERPPTTEGSRPILDLSAVREHYQDVGLHRDDLHPDPFEQFRAWYVEWQATAAYDPAAVALATATPDGRPSVRFVLVRQVDHGFCFFTDTTGRKGGELATNPQAALCFGWIDLSRQIRVEGPVERLTPAEDDAYWEARPRGSRISAASSAQSRPIADRVALEARRTALEAEVGDDGPVARPEGWGGYRLVPEVVEVWQGRADRLHDRFTYTRTPDGGWTIQRLMP